MPLIDKNPRVAQTILRKHLHEIIDIARLAPSVHNTQPWKVRQIDNSIEVAIDSKHKLKYGDPTGRQTYISLGIFVEAVIIAAAKHDLEIKKTLISEKHILAEFKVAEASSNLHEELLRYLKTRSTDRSVYRPAVISPKDVNIIESSPSEIKDVKVWLNTDALLIKNVADLTSRGISLALTNPKFRMELSRYLTYPWSKEKRGISVRSLRIPTLLATIEPLLIRYGLTLNSEVKLEQKRWDSASGIVLLASRGDIRENWFEIGRVYLRVSLILEKLGFSQATSAAIVEASTYHEDIEKYLSTNYRIQSIIRIGAGSSRKIYSPRVPVEQIIT